MAFCPNCGTPNTDQAEKCVACGFEFAPKQKAKFKGTVMMSGIKVPGQAPEAGSPSAPPTPNAAPEQAANAPSSAPPEAERSARFQKTMVGHAKVAPPASAPETASSARPSARGRAATMFGYGPAPTETGETEARAEEPNAETTPHDADEASASQRAAAVTSSTNERPAGATGLSFGSPPSSANRLPGDTSAVGAAPSFGSVPSGRPGDASAASGPTGGGFGGPSFAGPSSGASFGTGTVGGRPAGFRQPGAIDSRFPSASANKPSPGKAVAIGCGLALFLFCSVTGLLWAKFGHKLGELLGAGSDASADAAAWQASISQSLVQVAALCQTSCEQASVFFHPNVPAATLTEAKSLTEARIQKLSDPQSSKAQMLDATDDEELATKLGLDPQQCARVVAGAAKVVSCSVPETDGRPSVLRIVHLSGLSSL